MAKLSTMFTGGFIAKRIIWYVNRFKCQNDRNNDRSMIRLSHKNRCVFTVFWLPTDSREMCDLWPSHYGNGKRRDSIVITRKNLIVNSITSSFVFHRYYKRWASHITQAASGVAFAMNVSMASPSRSTLTIRSTA